MRSVKKILRDVLEDITPKPQEHAQITAQANAFLKDLNAALKKNRTAARAMFGGSFAKGTWLRGDYDIDVFVKFALAHKNQNLSELLEKALKKWNAERVHGSRDYFWVRNGKITYEIIPVLDIRKPEDAQNVTDFSPLHVAWVNSKGKTYKDDIRLAKKFCKAQGVYGAESYIRGFSGHVVDILVIYYKGFVSFVKAAARWKPKEVIDYYRVYDKDVFLRLNKSKIEGPLIVIDPLQKDRNAAAAVSKEKFAVLVTVAQKFLRRPGREFFVEAEIDVGTLAKKGHLVHLTARARKDREDVTGNKLLQAYEYVRKALEEFGILASGWRWNKQDRAEFWYVLRKNALPATRVHEGPPVKLADAVKKFRKKHKKTFVKKGRVFAHVRREVRTPAQAVRAAAKDTYVKSRHVRVTIQKA